MLKLLGGLLYLFIVYSLSIFWTSIMIVRTAIIFFKNPKGFFYLKPRPDKPECLKNPEFRHGILQLYDSTIRLHYAEAGDPRKPLLLFIHGFPEFWYSWRHQMREFKNDYHVVALDLRGYGESTKPKSVNDYSLSKLVEDVRLAIAELGGGKCLLVAHDWGGAIAFRFTIKYPDMVEKLIICNAPHPVAFQKLLMSGYKQWLKSWYMYFFQCPYLPEMLMRANDLKWLVVMLAKPPAGCTNPNAFTEEDIEAWKYTFQQPGALTAAINYYRAIVPARMKKEESHGPAEENVSTANKKSKGKSDLIVKPPTLIIWGTNDIALSTELAQGSLQQCQQGNLRLIEGASHWVQQDRPELVNQYIRDFLKN